MRYCPRHRLDRFPLAPLLDLLSPDDREAARQLQVSPNTIRRWRKGERAPWVGVVLADEYALRLGRHPVNIWSEWEIRAPDRIAS